MNYGNQSFFSIWTKNVLVKSFRFIWVPMLWFYGQYYTTLNINKATGPDQIGNRILKESSRVLAEPLSKLFNICIRSGIFPSSWKRAHVIPLHKSGDLTLCNNYRPISLLSSVSKVFETVIFKHIYQFLKVHNLLSEKQSGFIPRDSTVIQLTKICHEFVLNLIKAMKYVRFF